MTAEERIAALLGGQKVVGRKVTDRLAFAEAVAKGFQARALDQIKKELDLTQRQLAALLSSSEKTLFRLRKYPQRHLDASLSDRLYRIAKILRLAEQVLEDPSSARSWLRQPQIGLGGRTPIELLTTEAGAREVEDLLGRIEYGVLA